MNPLDAILKPKSIAVVGASRREGAIGREILHQLIEFDFHGKLFPVNPKADFIHSIKAFPTAPENALSTQEESDPFTIDNTPPRITRLAARGRTMEWHAADDLSTIVKAEYSLDGGDWTVVDPVTKLSDSRALDYALTLANLSPGEHTVAVRVTDDFDNTTVEKVLIR